MPIGGLSGGNGQFSLYLFLSETLCLIRTGIQRIMAEGVKNNFLHKLFWRGSTRWTLTFGLSPSTDTHWSFMPSAYHCHPMGKVSHSTLLVLRSSLTKSARRANWSRQTSDRGSCEVTIRTNKHDQTNGNTPVCFMRRIKRCW